MSLHRQLVLLLICCAASHGGGRAPAIAQVALAADDQAAATAQSAAAKDEFFERRIRPVLSTSCFPCHAKGDKSKGGLDLSTREGLLKGGRRGPAVALGDPESSLLLKAIRRLPDAPVKMPPKSTLPEPAIDDFTLWIAEGMPWPAAPTGVADEASLPGDWAFEPIRDPPPPTVADNTWPRQELDHFVLARLESAGIAPAPPIDKRGFVRRVTFDLIGLPPTAEEIDAYLTDDAADAESRLVDRLLASPHYGERWARHWLDVVRYAETDGHEFDVDKPNAYRYRDYTIEAFNRDLPFDQFVREQIAGDRIPIDDQRTSSDGATRLAPIGTGFWYLGEVQNTPVDEQQDRANQVENQLDVFGKAFMGLTLGCARCHDHKFDPIPTADYYALAGFLYSSDKRQQCVEGLRRESELANACAEIIDCDRELNRLTKAATIDQRIAGAERLAQYLMATREVLQGPRAGWAARCQQASKRRSLDHSRLEQFTLLVESAADAPGSFLWLWRELLAVDDSHFPSRFAAIAQNPTKAIPKPEVAPVGPAVKSPPTMLADFDGTDFAGWSATGAAFGLAPTPTEPAICTGAVGPGLASSGRVSGVLTGRLTSPRFTITRPFIWFRIGGANDTVNCRISLVVNGQPLGLLTETGRGDHHLEQRYFDVHELLDREVFLEIVDESDAVDGFIGVDEIMFADEPPPVLSSRAPWQDLLAEPVASRAALAAAYQQLLIQELESYRDNSGRADTSETVRWALRADVPLAATNAAMAVDVLTSEIRDQVSSLRARRADSERRLGPSTIALVAADVEPQDVAIQQRGEASQPGPVVSRGFLSCIETLDHQPARLSGSGRRELADWVASPRNPLTARVIVNRVWLHHFGRGIVPTPDNFGASGERPSHPELLDYLASRLMESGWSLKALHRAILLSATYRQGSEPASEAQAQDTDNRLLHHVPQRRLEAECLRDAMLLVAGNLDRRLYGPSAKLHLTPYMDGHDLPKTSGPLDGGGRRSIYLEVRRNHLTPLLAVFNYPRPLNAAGVRHQAIIPAQALSMMNNPFVVKQAREWGDRLAESPGTAREKVIAMFLAAFGREPDESERREALGFVNDIHDVSARAGEGSAPSSEAAWAELAHVLFMLPEFQIVR
ncbi:MAG: PSD1 and planctomycete cytochrome C domain-containing protein [Pirellulales bacterium]